MIHKTRAVARKYGAKLALAPMAALASLPALAQEDPSASEQVLSAVNGGFASAQEIAVAIVIGLFAIYAIKLMWRAK